MTNEQIAEVCHEANRVYCESLGDSSQKSWQLAEEWQKESAIEGVAGARAGTRTPAQSHQSWLDHKTAENWAYGAVKDVDAKIHPCMLPYDELPDHQRKKDAIFLGIVRLLA
jgi:hypothetical protein